MEHQDSRDRGRVRESDRVCPNSGAGLRPGGSGRTLVTLEADTLIADKGYDADQRVIEPLQQAGKTVVIPPKRNRKVPRDYDRHLYKARHLIESFFCKLKQFRAIATRYDKTDRNFLAALYLAASVIWLN